MHPTHSTSGSPAHLVLHTGLAQVSSLSPRERQVFELLGSAPTLGDLADELHISLRTVKFHVRNIRIKLGDLSYVQLCVTAHLHQLYAVRRARP